MQPSDWVKRYSAAGHPFQVWERPLPRIPDEWLDTSIYLYPSHPDAVEGKRTGGSGFLVHYDFENLPGRGIVYAVTNAHVIEQGSCTIRVNTRAGDLDVIDLDERHWIIPSSRDDIAIAPIALDLAKYRFRTISSTDIATKQMVEEFAIGPGDDAFVVGRFVNAEGRQQNLPTLRFGNIAQMPHEKIKQDRVFGVFEQESYLVEARTISGYSGSPVCVLLDPTWKRPGRPNLTEDKVRLLGVTWGYIQDWERVCDSVGRPLLNEHRVKANTGMMAVVPAWHLMDLLNRDDFRAHRARSEEMDLKAQKAPATSLASALAEMKKDEASAPPASDANPKHREDFTRLLGAAVKKPAQED